MLREADYVGEQGLSFIRNYSSIKYGPDHAAITLGWRHNFSRRLVDFRPDVPMYDGKMWYDPQTRDWYPKSQSMPSNAVTIYREDGASMFFASNDGGGHFSTDSDTNYALSATKDVDGKFSNMRYGRLRMILKFTIFMVALFQSSISAGDRSLCVTAKY